MVPSGSPTPIGASQTVSNSGLMGSQGGGAQSGIPSLVSPRLQFNNVNMMGNPNMSSLLQPPFGNVEPNAGLSGPGNSQRGVMGISLDSDQLLTNRNAMGFNPNHSSITAVSNIANTGQGQAQGQQLSTSSANHILPDQQLHQIQQPLQQFSASQNIHQQPSQQVSAPLNVHQQQQQQYQSIRGGLAGTDQHSQLSQQIQSLRNLDPQQLQSLRNLDPLQIQSMKTLESLKIEPSQHQDQSLFLHSQQQQLQQQLQHQQQLLHMSRKSPQSDAHFNNLHQQRLLQLQHHQQQQQQHASKAIPSRSSTQSQFQPQSFPVRPHVKPIYETGMCALRLTHYMYQQQQRPEDNNIEFWRKFVAEYFAPNAKKKWCVSMYGSSRQTTGVFPQDVWHCEICNMKPGRGFEATVEVLPRLLKIKYESGTLEELLYVDMPREYQNSSGQIVLHYVKAIQECVFDQLRVVRDGQLRIVFNPDLKIHSWEFCARHHEELIPRRLMIPQVSQLGAAAQKYQAATQNGSSSIPGTDLQNTCNAFVISARQLAKTLEVPLVNDLGYTKRYIRCLQIAEVVNSMRDLIECSTQTGTGPMKSLARYSLSRNHPVLQAQTQQTKEEGQLQQLNPTIPNSNNIDERPEQMTTASTSPAPVLLQQTSMGRSQTSIANANNGPLVGLGVQIPSPSSSSTILHAQQNPSPVTSSNNRNPNQNTHGGLSPSVNLISANALSGDTDASMVQKIFNEMMMQNGGAGMMGMKNVNGMIQTNSVTGHKGGNLHGANGTSMNNSGMTGAPFGGLGSSFGHQSAMMNGMQGLIGGNLNGNAITLNGLLARQQQQQQGSGDQQLLISSNEQINGFNNLQFDWRPTP